MSRICSFQTVCICICPFSSRPLYKKTHGFCSLLPPKKNNEKLLPLNVYSNCQGTNAPRTSIISSRHSRVSLPSPRQEIDQFWKKNWPEKSLDISHCKLNMKPFKKESHLTKASDFEILWLVVNWGRRKQHGIYFHQRSLQACSILGGV